MASDCIVCGDREFKGGTCRIPRRPEVGPDVPSKALTTDGGIHSQLTTAAPETSPLLTLSLLL
ncbi:hypothetical protein ACX80E_05570 [Arthrobacter sp. TMN-49]